MKRLVVALAVIGMMFLSGTVYAAEEDIVVLTNASPNTTITAGSYIKGYGTAGANHITLESGAKAELLNFPGNNTITIQSDSSLFTVSRSGATVTFEESDGTVLKIPATTTSQSIVFNDGSRSLIIDSGQVMLEKQILNINENPISQTINAVVEKIETIKTIGGSLEITDPNSDIFGTIIVIPSDGVNTNTYVEIGVQQEALPENPNAEPTGVPIYFGPEGTIFLKNVQITIPYDESLLPAGASEEDIKVNCWDGTNWRFTLNNNVDVINNTVSFETSHFSVFQANYPGEPYSKGLEFLQEMDEQADVWEIISAPLSLGQEVHAAILDLNPNLDEHDDAEITKIEALAGVDKYQTFVDRVISIGNSLMSISSENKKEWINEFHAIYETIKVLTPLEDDPLIIASEEMLKTLFPSVFNSWGIGGMFSLSCFIVESSLKAIYQEAMNLFSVLVQQSVFDSMDLESMAGNPNHQEDFTFGAQLLNVPFYLQTVKAEAYEGEQSEMTVIFNIFKNNGFREESLSGTVYDEAALAETIGTTEAPYYLYFVTPDIGKLRVGFNNSPDTVLLNLYTASDEPAASETFNGGAHCLGVLTCPRSTFLPVWSMDEIPGIILTLWEDKLFTLKEVLVDAVTLTIPLKEIASNCTDEDNDGYFAESECGTEIDCDDTNPNINPGMFEIPEDGIDNDCKDGDALSGGGIVVIKPIIYLYPESIQKIKVAFEKPDSVILTTTYPEYGLNGWNVLAYPDGTLYDTETGFEYYALYWEGDTPKIDNFETGFVIKGQDIRAFLENTLEQLGLTRREANEFIVFWLPILEKNSYNFIHFSTDVWKNNVPLKIEPEPDTLIRFMMYYEPLSLPVQVNPQMLESPVRIGFTVVEWGGGIIE